MGAVARRQLAMQGRVLRHFGDGGTVVIRRRHTLKVQNQGKGATALLVNGAFSAGATAIGLRGALLEGVLWKGCKVTILSVEYTVVGVDVEASGGALAGVQISPALAGNVSDGTAATVTGTYVDFTFTASRGSIEVDVLDTGERRTQRVLHLVPAGTITPSPEDLVVDGGVQKKIADVKIFNPGGGAARFDLVVGGRS